MSPRCPTPRAVTWLILAAYALVVAGVPLPFAGSPPATGSPAAKRLAGKDRSQPFPCLDKPCGCATAEQCFASCCCNSPAELLAWAKTNRVDPLTLLALQRRAAATLAGPPATSCCCSSAAAEPACCTESADARRVDDPAPAEAMVAFAPSPGLSLRAMLACGGIHAGWSAAITSLPPPDSVRCDEAQPVVALIAIADDVGLSAEQPTEAPPPRV